MDILQGEDTVPSPRDQENIHMHTEDDGKKPQEEAGTVLSTQPDNTERNAAPKATSATCKPVAAERPKIVVNLNHLSERIDARIRYMKDHALIGKFIGFWPREKALHGWIAAKWKPKEHITLQLGAKGFFTTIFNCIEDRKRVLDRGPYFFNAASLYLGDWIERFNPDKEDAQLKNNGEQQRAAQRNRNARDPGKQQTVENSATLHATDSRARDTKATGDVRGNTLRKHATERSSVGTQPVRQILCCTSAEEEWYKYACRIVEEPATDDLQGSIFTDNWVARCRLIARWRSHMMLFETAAQSNPNYWNPWRHRDLLRRQTISKR